MMLNVTDKSGWNTAILLSDIHYSPISTLEVLKVRQVHDVARER